MNKILKENKKRYHSFVMKRSGFTLLETLIYVVIFSFFVVALASFGSDLTANRRHSQVVLEVNDQGSKAMKTITQSVRNASQVNSPTITNTALNLSLVTELPINSPTVFSESDGVLYITEGSGAPVALTNNKVIVSNLVFSNFSRPSTPNIIKISFTISSATASTSLGGAYTFTFNGSASLRK